MGARFQMVQCAKILRQSISIVYSISSYSVNSAKLNLTEDVIISLYTHLPTAFM